MKAFINAPESVVCRVCGSSMKQITMSHLAKHGLTVAQYRDEFRLARGDLFSFGSRKKRQDNLVRRVAEGSIVRDTSILKRPPTPEAREKAYKILRGNEGMKRVRETVWKVNSKERKAKASASAKERFGRMTPEERRLYTAPAVEVVKKGGWKWKKNRAEMNGRKE